mgnify:CR=1
MNIIGGTLAIILIAIIGFVAISYGIEKHEIAECQKWQMMESPAAIERGYYITPWQYEQCGTYGYHLKAPIK